MSVILNSKNFFQVLEVVDDKLEKTDITFVKFSDDDVALEEFGLTEDDLPKLIFFDNQIPVKKLIAIKLKSPKLFLNSPKTPFGFSLLFLYFHFVDICVSCELQPHIIM